MILFDDGREKYHSYVANIRHKSLNLNSPKKPDMINPAIKF